MLGVLITLLVVAAAAVLLGRTIKGFEIRVVGAAPRAARFGGFIANQSILLNSPSQVRSLASPESSKSQDRSGTCSLTFRRLRLYRDYRRVSGRLDFNLNIN